jgi:hypothetical protein
MQFRRIALGLLLVLALVAAGAVYAVSRSNATVLSEAELLKLARGYANSLGMVGEPDEEQYVMTTLGIALTLQRTGMTSDALASVGKTRQTPAFLYRVRGDIPFLTLAPEYGRVEYLFLELDASTGRLHGINPFGEEDTPHDLTNLPPDEGEPTYPTPNFTPLSPPDIPTS